MNLWKLTLTTLALGMALGTIGCGSDSVESGNNGVCEEGGNCTFDCKWDDKTCNVDCGKNSTCNATCQAGQSCNFSCGTGAKCDFNCNAGSCNVSGGPDCKCSGDCIGTCGGVSTGTGGSTGVGTDDCESKCGSPTDPGYAQCIQDCNDQ